MVSAMCKLGLYVCRSMYDNKDHNRASLWTKINRKGDVAINIKSHFIDSNILVPK